VSEEEQINPEVEEAEASETPEAIEGQESQLDESLESTDVDALRVELEQAQQEAQEAKDQALRSAAEAQNIRRRSEKDVENAHKYALEKFSGELLVVVDNLERALDSADRENESIGSLIEGVELTHKSFIDVLTKFHLEQVDPSGEPFDPQVHQAMSMVENPDVEPNTVVAVMQKGYTLNGRLIRPAMVMVSKASGDQKPSIDETV